MTTASPSLLEASDSRAEALRYHRLGRTTPGWWRPLVILATFVGLYAGLFLASMLVLVVVGVAVPEFGAALDRAASSELDQNDPAQLTAMLLTLGAAVPVARWAVRLGGRPGGLDSVAGRFRWGLFGAALAPAGVAVAAAVVSLWLVEPVVPRVTSSTGALLAITVLLVPLQAAGEEYVFRGLLPQVVGAWLRSPLWGVLVSVPLFVFGHSYEAAGLASVGLFAGVAAWVTWRTGGLEAAVALHAVNNVAAFALQAFGMADPNDPGASWVDAGLTAIIPVGFALLLEVWWRRTGVRRYASVLAPVGHGGEGVCRFCHTSA